MLPFDPVVMQLPTRLERDGRSFALAYKQVFEGEVLARVLLIIRDVTAEMAAERAGHEARERQEILGWLLKDKEGLRSFVKDAEQLLEQLRNTSDAVMAKRLIHTLKGNAALYSFTSVAEQCHALESELEEHGGHPSVAQISVLGAALTSRLRGLEEFLQLQRSVIELEDAEYSDLVAGLENRRTYAELLELVQRWRWPKASHLLARLGGQIAQLGRNLGKPVRVVVEDRELRLAPDRLDGFLSTLVHVACNAVDHGIESADERTAAGKPREGVITLSLRLDREQLVLEIQDDGRGINIAALTAVAARRGLPLRGARDVVDLLFTDGVSTQDTVTDTSGRGVGLAAVRAACEELGGSVDVRWTEGRSTTFCFSLPATLARATQGPERQRRATSPIPTIAVAVVPQLR